MSCPACFSGHEHSGNPTGTITKVHGLDCYVSEPAEGTTVKGIIVIIPDAFGWKFVNNRLLADHYVSKGGYKVYLPEFMDGHAASTGAIPLFGKVFGPNKGFMDYLLLPINFVRCMSMMVPFLLNCDWKKTYPPMKEWLTALRKEEAAHVPLCAAGFCWGGKHTLLLAAESETIDGKPLIDVAFTAHPSNITIPADIEKIRKPVSFAIGDLDIAIKLPHIEQIKKVVDAQDEAYKGEVRVYAGAGHGFGVRADHILPDSIKQAAESEDQCIDWFNAHIRDMKY